MKPLSLRWFALGVVLGALGAAAITAANAYAGRDRVEQVVRATAAQSSRPRARRPLGSASHFGPASLPSGAGPKPNHETRWRNIVALDRARSVLASDVREPRAAAARSSRLRARRPLGSASHFGPALLPSGAGPKPTHEGADRR